MADEEKKNLILSEDRQEFFLFLSRVLLWEDTLWINESLFSSLSLSFFPLLSFFSFFAINPNYDNYVFLLYWSSLYYIWIIFILTLLVVKVHPSKVKFKLLS